MITITVLPNQTLYDLAVQHYGTVEGVPELIRINPDLSNNGESLSFDRPILPGSILSIDDSSPVYVKKTIKEINPNNVTTWQDPSMR